MPIMIIITIDKQVCRLSHDIAKLVGNGHLPIILGVHGHSRSSMLAFLKSSKPVLVMISSMSVPGVPICNHFHVR